jgi:hypothetical protein
LSALLVDAVEHGFIDTALPPGHPLSWTADHDSSCPLTPYVITGGALGLTFGR